MTAECGEWNEAKQDKITRRGAERQMFFNAGTMGALRGSKAGALDVG